MLRALLVIIGMAIIVGVIYLRFLTTSNQGLIPWFGIAAAVLAPAGFALIGLAFYSRDRVAIRGLEKVPEINDLIQKANSQEEKLKALQEERTELLQVIEYEAQTKAFESRRISLESDAARILNQLDDTDSRLIALERDISFTPLSPEVQELRARVHAKQRGDFVIRMIGSDLFIPRRALEVNPFFAYFEMIETLIASLRKSIRSHRNKSLKCQSRRRLSVVALPPLQSCACWRR